MKARYQYRIYPTDQQKRLLSQLFGCVRVVWNDTLAYCQELYRQGEKKPKYTFFASCKGERKGRKVKPPKFKKRKSKQSARFTDNGFTINQYHVTLAKIGDLRIVWSRPLPSKPSSVTVIKDAADRYFLSFVVEIQPEILPNNGESVGIDLGIATFATLSTGEKIDAPKPLKKRLKRLRRASEKPF